MGKHPFFHKCRTLPLYNRWLTHQSDSTYGNPLIAAKKSPFPPLGPIIWKSKSRDFDAYVYSLNDKSIGYIRIPDFLADADEVEEFRNIITVMEDHTHALVIDVMNNPGGLAYYTYALIAMLTDKPLLNLKEAMTITQEDVYFAVQQAKRLSDVDSDDAAAGVIGEDICGYIVDERLAISIIKLAHFIKDQFREGKFITDQYPMEGLEYIYPHPTTHYAKPILVLTNSLSISCGDLFPALLQDNKRALVFGCHTAGAGGYVLTKQYSNRFGVANFTLTGSLIYRFDGKPLENRGVNPDFPYAFTLEDLTNGYKPYTRAVNDALESMLK